VIRTIYLLKISYISGYLAKHGIIEKPISLELNAKSGDGKTYLLKRFTNANEGIKLISGEDLTANQFRERIIDLKSYYTVIFDDIRFRDERTKKVILSQITSVADMEFKFKQEAGETEEQIKASIILSFNTNQHASMQKIKQTMGLSGRLFQHKWTIDLQLYNEIKQLKIPRDEDLRVNLDEFQFSNHTPDILYERFKTDFRRIEQINTIYAIAKSMKLDDKTIKELLERSIAWNIDYWKKKESKEIKKK